MISTCAECGEGFIPLPDYDYYSPHYCRNCMYIAEKSMDLEWFLENRYVITWREGEPIYFKLEPHQREVVQYIKQCIKNKKRVRIIVRKGRRIGMSELMSAIIAWYAGPYSQYVLTRKVIDIYSGSESQAIQDLDKIKLSIDASPCLRSLIGKKLGKVQKLGKSIRFRPVPMGLDKDGKLIEHEEMSSIIRAKASGGAKKRGADPDLSFYDEAAVIDDDDYYATSIASSSQSGWEIIIGTPLGEGFFESFFERFFYKSQNRGEYKVFYFPTVEVDEEGEELIRRGLTNEIQEKHITKIRGINWTPEIAVSEISRLPFYRAMTEVFARIIPSFKNYFPKEIIKQCIRPRNERTSISEDPEFLNRKIDDLDNRTVYRWIRERYSNITEIRIGIDWAKTNDESVITIFAVDFAGHYYLIAKDSWRKMNYDDQFERVKMIYDTFTDPQQEVITTLYPDATAGQDMASDVLARQKGCRVVPVDFKPTTKFRMAEKLYSLMQRRMISFPDDETILRSLFSVDNRIKSEDGHLDDTAASIFAAVFPVVFTEVFENIEEEPRKVFFRSRNYRGNHIREWMHRSNILVRKSKHINWRN